MGEKPAHLFLLRFCATHNRIPSELNTKDLPEIGRFLNQNLILFVGAKSAEHIYAKLITQIQEGLKKEELLEEKNLKLDSD